MLKDAKKDPDLLACELSHLEERHQKLRDQVQAHLIMCKCDCTQSQDAFKDLWSALVQDILESKKSASGI